METIYVKPRRGVQVRQPEKGNAIMPKEGALVARDTYYERRLAAGDVHIADDPAEAKAEAPEADAADAPKGKAAKK